MGSNKELPDGTYKLRLRVTYRHFEGVSDLDPGPKTRPETQITAEGFEIKEDMVKAWKILHEDNGKLYGPGDRVNMDEGS